MSTSRAPAPGKLVRANQGALGVAAIALASVLLIFTQSGFVLVALGLLAVGALALLRWPWLIFVALVASVPVQQLILIPAGGRVVTLTQLAVVASLGIAAIAIATDRIRLTFHVAYVPLSGLLLALLITVGVAQSPMAALSELARWCITAWAFILAMHFLADGNRFKLTLVVVALGLGGLFQAAFGVVQSVLALGPDSFLLNSGVSRAFGTFGMPNTYAGFLEIVLFPVFWVGVYYCLLAFRRVRPYRFKRLRYGMVAVTEERRELLLAAGVGIILIGLALMTAGGIIASLSRGAWLGVIAGALLTAFLVHRILRVVILAAIPIAVLSAVSGAIAYAPAPIAERIESGVEQFQIVDPVTVEIDDDNFATLERLAHWQAGWRMFDDSPLLGVGIGNFNDRYSDYYVRDEFDHSAGHAHNYYIHMLAEAGLAGFAFYLMFIGGIVVAGIRTAFRARNDFYRLVSIGAVGSVVAVATHNVVENLHVLNLGIAQAALWALILVSHEATFNPNFVER
ncbi:MAG: O-antigen ligase family protein [Chloroflexota bacterium]